MPKFKIIRSQNIPMMIKDIVDAVKYTSEIHGYDKYEQLKGSILNIIFYGKYNTITSEKGFRDNVRKYSSDQLLNLVVEFAKVYDDNDSIIESNGSYYIDSDNLKRLVDKLCDSYLYKEMDKASITIPNDKKVIPEQVVYYEYSNSLKNAIFEERQTKLRNSSHHCNGMYAYSDVGLKRSNQEDSYYIGVHPSNSNFKIMAVCDGAGGHELGEVASNIAIKNLITWFENLDSKEFYSNDNSNLKKNLSLEIDNINRIIRSQTNGRTTLCMTIIKNNCIFVANVGDSKGFIFENNKLVFNTIPEDASHLNQVPEVLARFYKGGNMIYNCLGGSDTYVNCDIIQINPNNSYKIIICSDGVTDCLGDKKIVDISTKGGNVSKALVECALENTSYLKYELMSLGFFARRKIDENQFYPEINAGKDNSTALYGEIKRR